MTSSSLICSKCGFSNIPGDQFCGSCGSFLEWEGVPGEAPPGDPDIPIPDGPTPLPAPLPVTPLDGPPTWDPPTTPYPAPTPTPTAGGGEVGAGLVRCPACGIANPPGRTFCQSCGNKLPEASRVEEATAEQIAAAVAAPNRPPVVQTRQGSAQWDEEEGSGGIGKWLIAVVVLGVIVGAAVVAALTFLRSDAVPGASAAPSAAVVPSASAPTASSEAPADSVPPVASVPLVLTGAKASSVVGDPDNPSFVAGKVRDGKSTTAWKAGTADAAGQFIEVTFDAARVTSIIIANGHNESDVTYKRTPRLHDILISIDGGEGIEAELEDDARNQVINVTPVDGATTVRITIVSVFPGTAVGDRKATRSAALNEIVVMGVTGE